MYGQENKAKIDEFLNGLKYLNAQMGMLYNLYPIANQGLQSNSVITSEEYNNDVEKDLRSELRETVKSVLQMKQLENPNFNYEDTYNLNNEIDGKEPQILFLGTVSMKPTMYRSASAIYVFIKG